MLGSVGAALGVGLTACSTVGGLDDVQGASTSGPAPAATSDAAPETSPAGIPSPPDAAPLQVRPLPFDGGAPRLLVVRADTASAPAGVAAWRSGVERQARAAGAVVEVVDGDLGGPATAVALTTALTSGVDGVLLHGVDPLSCWPAWRALTAAGVPIVAQGGAPVQMDVPRFVRGTVVVRGDDTSLTHLVLDAMSTQVADGRPVGLVAPPPIEVDVERRLTSWQQQCAARSWRQVLVDPAVAGQLDRGFLQSDGGPPESNASYLIPQLRAHPEAAGFFCADETLAMSLADACSRLAAPPSAPAHCVGGALIDVGRLVAPTSPWQATALVDETELGAAGVRALLLRLTGQLGDLRRPQNEDITLSGQLVVREDLRAAGVTTSEQLWAALPHLPGRQPVTAFTSAWLPNALG